jgi:hypothetical protein
MLACVQRMFMFSGCLCVYGGGTCGFDWMLISPHPPKKNTNTRACFSYHVDIFERGNYTVPAILWRDMNMALTGTTTKPLRQILAERANTVDATAT